MNSFADVAIIGGGIVGCASALTVSLRHPGLKIVLLEKEGGLARHQTGHNSGVIHAGLYYRPGSLKAATCTVGREALYRFCNEHSIPHRRCGKIVVAVDESELSALDEIERRGNANGLDGLQRLTAAGLREREPHIRGVAGLFVPQTGVVDFVSVTEKMAELFRLRGGIVHLNAPVDSVRTQSDHYLLQTGQGSLKAHSIINCAGLHADRLARLAGLRPDLRIVPFRGEYYELRPERRHLVNHLIYPVPDPRMPFLGVHFTRRIDDSVEAGPNAVLAWQREGYGRWDVSPRDLFEILTFSGFWKLAGRFWHSGIEEYGRSFSKKKFVNSLQRLMPEISNDDLAPGGSGVRAQAVDREGRLIDDFRLLADGRMIHVLNAPSPAATASLSIAERIADRLAETMG